MTDNDCTVQGIGVSKGKDSTRAKAELAAKEKCNEQSLTSCQSSQDEELRKNKEACETSPADCTFSSELIPPTQDECKIKSCAFRYFYGWTHTYSDCTVIIQPYNQVVAGQTYDIRECGHNYENCKITTGPCVRLPLSEAIENALKEKINFYECIAEKRYNQDSYECKESSSGTGDCTGGVCV